MGLTQGVKWIIVGANLVVRSIFMVIGEWIGFNNLNSNYDFVRKFVFFSIYF
jgi:hypothetical protein